MAARDSQNNSFINNVRAQGTALLNIDDVQGDIQNSWNSFFGGEAQLVEGDFVADNDGLDKTDIENVLVVLSALKTWIDEAGQNRRVYLQKVRIL